MNALITFGCSWTNGKASCYPREGMSEDEFSKKKTRENYNCSFRKTLSERHNYVNINHAACGSSNCKQFRRAEEYFNTDDYKKYDNVIVLWGLTSTARYELWDLTKKKYRDYSLGKKNPDNIASTLRDEHYDHNVKVKRLSTQIKHWDNYFRMLGLKNYWFDTFNHHDYDYKSPNMICVDDNPRDILSKLCGGIKDDKYHHSKRVRDSERIKILEKKNLVNPYSLHPNIDCHMMIADILDKYVNFCYYK